MNVGLKKKKFGKEEIRRKLVKSRKIWNPEFSTNEKFSKRNSSQFSRKSRKNLRMKSLTLFFPFFFEKVKFKIFDLENQKDFQEREVVENIAAFRSFWRSSI